MPSVSEKSYLTGESSLFSKTAWYLSLFNILPFFFEESEPNVLDWPENFPDISFIKTQHKVILGMVSWWASG